MEKRLIGGWDLIGETRACVDQYAPPYLKGQNIGGVFLNGWCVLGIEISDCLYSDGDRSRMYGIIIWNKWFGLWKVSK